MSATPTTRDCTCTDAYKVRHGEHSPECHAALKAKLWARVRDEQAVFAEHHGPERAA